MITTYGPRGNIVDGPRQFENLIATSVGERSPFIGSSAVPGDFSPYSVAWNIEVSQRMSRVLTIQAGYLQSYLDDLLLIPPTIIQGHDARALTSGGKSRYRQVELTTRVSWTKGQQFFFSYVHSCARGDLNEFNNYIGNFPFPIVPPNRFEDLPSDVPNHFLMWGQTRLPQRLRLSSVLEYRNGFPYQARDVAQNYVSLNPAITRFPNFFALDVSLARDFRLSPKYVLTITGKAFNLTDHFNALAVHNNTSDPHFGTFFGTYTRRFRLDFDVNL